MFDTRDIVVGYGHFKIEKNVLLSTVTNITRKNQIYIHCMIRKIKKMKETNISEI